MAPKIDHYRIESSIGNKLERGGPKSWDWTRSGGDYFKHRDFLSIHWEIHLPDSADVVRLHVEAPRFEMDETLNDLKREIVAALMAAGLHTLAASAGFESKAGSRVSIDSMKKNKCTEPFRVILSEKQRGKTHRDDIEAVHAVLGERIEEILREFAPRLEKEFNGR